MTYFPLRQTTCFFIPLVAPCKPLLPLNKRLPGILIELKAGKDRSEAQLEDLANVALQQINDRAYSVDLQAMNVTSIIKIGIAFSGKRTRIAAERQNIE